MEFENQKMTLNGILRIALLFLVLAFFLTVFSSSSFAFNYSTCSDGILSVGETAIDCGGAYCDGCIAGLQCSSNSDCLSLRCMSGYCFPATCQDGVKNQDESDIDCGGICDACLGGYFCKLNSDCASKKCNGGQCVQIVLSCSDGITNQDESDTDCGGHCKRCSAGNSCNTNGDCESNVCAVGTCAAASCFDNVQNQEEADVDCGGPCTTCILKGSEYEVPKPNDGKYTVSQFGRTIIDVETNPQKFSLSKILAKNTIRYGDNLLVENIIRNSGFGVSKIVVSEVIPKEFVVSAENYSSLSKDDDGNTLMVWEGILRGHESYSFDYYIKYDDKSILYFDLDNPVITYDSNTLFADNYIRVYRKTMLLEKMFIEKSLLYKENTDNVSVIVNFTNTGEVPLENIKAYGVIPKGAKISSSVQVKQTNVGEIILPYLDVGDSYYIEYESFVSIHDNLTSLPELIGILSDNVESSLLINREYVVIHKMFTFIKLETVLLILLLSFGIAYLYRVNKLRNQKNSSYKDAFSKAFFDLLLEIMGLFQKAGRLIAKAYLRVISLIRSKK